MNESVCSTNDVCTSPIEVFNLTMGEGKVSFLIDMQFVKIVGVGVGIGIGIGVDDSSLESSGTVGLHGVASIFVGSCTGSALSSPASALVSSSSLLCSWGNAGRIGTAGSSFGFIENDTGTGRNGHSLVFFFLLFCIVVAGFLNLEAFFMNILVYSMLIELTYNLWCRDNGPNRRCHC